MMRGGGPRIPEPKPITLDRTTAAVAVLDLSVRCNDPATPCSELIHPVGEFLERVRATSVPIVYSISLRSRGTDMGEVAPGLRRREAEPIIYPDASDKFMGGDLRNILERAGAQHLIIVGAATNNAVMYTATTAMRVYKYDVVIPVDGVTARSDYEQEYALHQLANLPSGSAKLVHYSTLGDITFL